MLGPKLSTRESVKDGSGLGPDRNEVLLAGQLPAPQQLYFGAKLYDAATVARTLELPVGTIRRMAAEGEIPSVRLGGRLRFNLEAVGSVLSQRAAQSYQGK